MIEPKDLTHEEAITEVIALRREVEMLRREKKARIYYQDLVYKACSRIDGAIGGTTVCGTLETPDRDFEERLDKTIKAKRLKWRTDYPPLKTTVLMAYLDGIVSMHWIYRGFEMQLGCKWLPVSELLEAIEG